MFPNRTQGRIWYTFTFYHARIDFEGIFDLKKKKLKIDHRALFHRIFGLRSIFNFFLKIEILIPMILNRFITQESILKKFSIFKKKLKIDHRALFHRDFWSMVDFQIFFLNRNFDPHASIEYL